MLAALTCMAAAAPHNAQTELKIFVLAGQSNMEGQAEVSTKNKTTGAYLNGTLAYQLSDPRTAKQFAPLWDSRTNNWTVLDDVKARRKSCVGLTSLTMCKPGRYGSTRMAKSKG